MLASRFGTLRSHATALGVTEPRVLVGVILGALVAGGLIHVFAPGDAGDLVWAAAIAITLVPLTWSVGRSLMRGDVGVDAIALVAMAGALALGEYLAGAVVALMLSGGNALEAAAGRRARRELTALLERAPRIAHRWLDGSVQEVPVEALRVGDRVLVRAGEVVPVDGVVQGGQAVLDESTLTGEPLPVTRGPGTTVASGSSNAGDAFDMRAIRTAAESAYSGIVRLVREAERQRAPFVRLADRYAAVLLPVTLVVAGAAWALSGDPVRALAVLVVATPCPLILAAPIALISGVSRAARAGVIVKGGGTIEGLGRARTVLFDKTGTLTNGRPEIERVEALDGLQPHALLRLAASVDQLSAHVLAEALVHGAEARGIELPFPEDVVEDPGQGVEGRVEGHRVTVGSAAWLERRGYSGARRCDRGRRRRLGARLGTRAGRGRRRGRRRGPDGRPDSRRRRRADRRAAPGRDRAHRPGHRGPAGRRRGGRRAGRRRPRLRRALARRTRSRWFARRVAARSCARWSWSATGSTMRRRWRSPTWASRWGPRERRSRPRPRTP